MTVDHDTGDEHVERSTRYNETCCMCGRSLSYERVWITPSYLPPRGLFEVAANDIASLSFKGEKLITCKDDFRCREQARTFAQAQRRGDRVYRAHVTAMNARRREWELGLDDGRSTGFADYCPDHDHLAPLGETR